MEYTQLNLDSRLNAVRRRLSEIEQEHFVMWLQVLEFESCVADPQFKDNAEAEASLRSARENCAILKARQTPLLDLHERLIKERRESK